MASVTPPYLGELERAGLGLLELLVECFRVPESEVRRIAEGLPISKEIGAVIYAHVSSSDRRSNLER